MAPASAAGGIANIRVVVADIATVTDQDGFFVLDGVPTGLETLIVQVGDATFTLEVIVPVDATVELRDIALVNGRARPADIAIKVRGDAARVFDEGDYERTRTVEAGYRPSISPRAQVCWLPRPPRGRLAAVPREVGA